MATNSNSSNGLLTCAESGPQEVSPGGQSFDFGRLQAFTQKLMTDFAAALAVLACGVGDRTGLFKALADGNAQTAGELASQTRSDPALVREWLRVVAAAGYVDYNRANETFTLPREHGVLADLDPTTGVGGGLQLFLGLAKAVEPLIAAFAAHSGIPQSQYDSDLRKGMERMSAPWFETLLSEKWIPAVAGLREKLRAGVRVADLGCGGGRAAIRLAQVFPQSDYVGYDWFQPAIEEARQNAKAAGAGASVRFVCHDITQGLPGQYHVITMFNSLHDVPAQRAALDAVREALEPEGCCLILESPFSDSLADNLHPMGAVLYGTSLFYNTPVSIANGGSGPGAAGVTESRVRELCREANLNVTRIPGYSPIHALYVATRSRH